MAYYLVSAIPKSEKEDELKNKLNKEIFEKLNPYGEALSYSLRHMRKGKDGRYYWEEEDYCENPLEEECKTVLNQYFNDIKIDVVDKGRGWAKIVHLPFVFPDLALKG